MPQDNMDLITIVVQHKDEKKVLAALKEAHITGATYFYGRGTGIRERMGMFGHFIEAEKTVVMTVVSSELTDNAVQAVAQAIDIDRPGKGFIFIQKIQRVVGFC